MRVQVIGEIGICHNGNVENVLKLIDQAKWAGFDAVKFQKRNPELYPERPYNSPLFGEMSYREHKRRLELSESDYRRIDAYCKEAGIEWFASCFDKESVDFIAQFKPKYWKIASPGMLDDDLVEYIGKQPGTIIMSTGMSLEDEVDIAIYLLHDRRADLVLLHCCSEYPTPNHHLNLRGITRYVDQVRLTPIRVGYSSHDGGVPCSVAAVALCAEVIEVHITLDRAMKGSDHAASLEREEMERLVRHIRAVEVAMGSYDKQFYEGERKIREKVSKK